MRFLEKIVYIYINMQTLLASTQILYTHTTAFQTYKIKTKTCRESEYV